MCLVCYKRLFQQAACLCHPCGHVFHLECLQNRITALEDSNCRSVCPRCHVPITDEPTPIYTSYRTISKTQIHQQHQQQLKQETLEMFGKLESELLAVRLFNQKYNSTRRALLSDIERDSAVLSQLKADCDKLSGSMEALINTKIPACKDAIANTELPTNAELCRSLITYKHRYIIFNELIKKVLDDATRDNNSHTV